MGSCSVKNVFWMMHHQVVVSSKSVAVVREFVSVPNVIRITWHQFAVLV